MLKKVIAMLLTSIMVLSGTVVSFGVEKSYSNSKEKPSVNLDSGISNFDGDLDYSEGARKYVKTAKNIKNLTEKMMSNIDTRYDPDAPYKIRDIQVFEQENGYYCGPATVKQVVHFIKGSSNSQKYYANILGTTTNGTDMLTMAEKLPDLTGKPYEYYEFGNKADWLTYFMRSVKGRMPAILDINTTGISEFPYSVPGHFVNSSGFDFRNGDKVRITDPWTPGLGNRWYSVQAVYNANAKHFRRAMIW